MKSYFALAFSLVWCQVQGAGNFTTAEMTPVIQYGIAWNMYWSTSLNSWDSTSGYEPAATCAHQMRGKRIAVTIEKESSKSEDNVSRFLVTIISTNMLAQRELQFSVVCSDKGIVGVGSSSAFAGLQVVSSDFMLQVPDDVTAPARIPPVPSVIPLIKKGLNAFVKGEDAKKPQHFFVGPFNKWSPKIIIYWVEKRAFLEVGYPSTDPEVPIESQFIQGRMIYTDYGQKGADFTPERRLEIEKSRVFWINRWIANCVTDGVLVEVGPK